MKALLPALLLAAACAAPQAPSPAAGRPWPAPLDAGISLSREHILASGEGRPDPAASGDTQRKATSRDGALADARERLRAYLRAIAPANASEPALNKLARLAEAVSTRWSEEGSASVVIRVPQAAVNEALGTEYR